MPLAFVHGVKYKNDSLRVPVYTTYMSKHLILRISTEIVNPSKMELISLSNLMWHSKGKSYIRYIFPDTSYGIHGHLDNQKIINHLSLADPSEDKVIVKSHAFKYSS